MDDPSIEKLLDEATSVFKRALAERKNIELTGQENYMRAKQYEQLAGMERACIETEAAVAMIIYQAEMTHRAALAELHRARSLRLQKILMAVDTLNATSQFANDVNKRIRHSDLEVLSEPLPPAIAQFSSSSSKAAPATSTESTDQLAGISKKPVMTSLRPPPSPVAPLPESILSRPLPIRPTMSYREDDKEDVKQKTTVSKSQLEDMRDRLSKISTETPLRRPAMASASAKLHPIITPRAPPSGVLLSSQGSLDGSVVPCREPPVPARFDDLPRRLDFDQTLGETDEEHAVSMPTRPILKSRTAPFPTVRPAAVLVPDAPAPPRVFDDSILNGGLMGLPLKRPTFKSDAAKAFLE